LGDSDDIFEEQRVLKQQRRLRIFRKCKWVCACGTPIRFVYDGVKAGKPNVSEIRKHLLNFCKIFMTKYAVEIMRIRVNKPHEPLNKSDCEEEPSLESGLTEITEEVQSKYMHWREDNPDDYAWLVELCNSRRSASKKSLTADQKERKACQRWRLDVFITANTNTLDESLVRQIQRKLGAENVVVFKVVFLKGEGEDQMAGVSSMGSGSSTVSAQRRPLSVANSCPEDVSQIYVDLQFQAPYIFSKRKAWRKWVLWQLKKAKVEGITSIVQNFAVDYIRPGVVAEEEEEEEEEEEKIDKTERSAESSSKMEIEFHKTKEKKTTKNMTNTITESSVKKKEEEGGGEAGGSKAAIAATSSKETEGEGGGGEGIKMIVSKDVKKVKEGREEEEEEEEEEEITRVQNNSVEEQKESLEKQQQQQQQQSSDSNKFGTSSSSNECGSSSSNSSSNSKSNGNSNCCKKQQEIKAKAENHKMDFQPRNEHIIPLEKKKKKEEEEEEEGTGGEKKEMEKEEEEDLSSYPPPPPNLTTGQIDVRIRATFKSLQRVEFIRTTWLKRLSEIPNHPKHGCPKCKIVQPNDFATQCITHGEIKAAIELHFKRHIHAERALRKADRGYSFSLGSIGTAKPIMQCATRGGEGISLIYIGEPEAALWCKVPAAPAAPAAPVAVSSSTAEAVVVSSNGEGKDSSASQAVTTVMPVSSA